MARWSPFVLGLMLIGCTYEPPERSAEWYENPQEYADESDAHPRREQFRTYLESAVADGLPGAVLLVRTPEEGTWVGAAGYADVASRVAWRPNTIGRVGSVTKLFAAALALKLADASSIALDAPARDYLPGRMSSRIDNADAVAVRQLLNYTSGIYNYVESPKLLLEALGTYNYEYHPKEELLESAYGHDAEFGPDAGWAYTNTPFLLFEVVAERATGRASDELLASTVLSPLGLRSTFYGPGGPAPRGLARGYGDLFGDERLVDVTDTEIERFHFDGGVVSNVYDLANFLDALLASPFLSDASRSTLLDVVPTGGNSERGTDFYGTGIMLEEHPEFGPIYGHSGTTTGFTAHVYRVERRGVTFAALVNASQGALEERSYAWFSPLTNDRIMRLALGAP